MPTAAVLFPEYRRLIGSASIPIAREALLAGTGLGLAVNRNATIGVSYVRQSLAMPRPRREGQLHLESLLPLEI
jgi:hypothetical protein